MIEKSKLIILIITFSIVYMLSINLLDFPSNNEYIDLEAPNQLYEGDFSFCSYFMEDYANIYINHYVDVLIENINNLSNEELKKYMDEYNYTKIFENNLDVVRPILINNLEYIKNKDDKIKYRTKYKNDNDRYEIQYYIENGKKDPNVYIIAEQYGMFDFKIKLLINDIDKGGTEY